MRVTKVMGVFIAIGLLFCLTPFTRSALAAGSSSSSSSSSSSKYRAFCKLFNSPWGRKHLKNYGRK